MERVKEISARTLGVRLIAWRYSSPSASAELNDMVNTLRLQTEMSEATTDNPEHTYEYERAQIAEYRLIPLVVVPRYTGLSARGRAWLPERWKPWHLADVWIDGKNSAVPSGVQP